MKRRSLLLLPLATLPLQSAPVVGEHDPSNAKLSHRMVIDKLSDDDLFFLQQLGIRWCRIEFGDSATYAEIKAAQERLAKFQMRIFSAVHYGCRNTDVQLGRGRRDELISTYIQFIRDCGKLGVQVANYDWHPANTYTTAMVDTGRGYKAREFSVEDFRNKVEKQAFEREYSADDIWATYSYFMKAVLPEAERAGVKLALHPDDPPLAKMNGVAKLFVHYDGCARAEKLVGGSKAWGLTFCVGTWSEGGDRMGKNVFQMIEDYGGRGKIIDVHFRNVSSPLPKFHETFQDDGYMDMYQVMKALRKVRFSGTIVPDHVPQLRGDTGMLRAGTAYCISNMRALLRRANEEVG